MNPTIDVQDQHTAKAAAHGTRRTKTAANPLQSWFDIAFDDFGAIPTPCAETRVLPTTSNNPVLKSQHLPP